MVLNSTQKYSNEISFPHPNPLTKITPHMYNDLESQGYNLKMAHMQGRNM